jgi:hypothetical protein
MFCKYDDEFDMIVDDIMEEHNETKEEVGDITHRRLDEYVSCNCIGKNTEIIDDFGGVFKYLKKYNDEFGDINLEQGEAHFYAVLAFVVLKELLDEKVEERIADKEDD